MKRCYQFCLFAIASTAVAAEAVSDEKDGASSTPPNDVSIADLRNEEIAKRHFEAGLKLLESHDYNGAETELRLSVNLLPNRNNIYNLANVYIARHQYGEALALFERLLSEYKDDLSKEMTRDVELQFKELSALVARLAVQVDVKDAEISIDGSSVGKSPLSSAQILGPGKHTVSVSFPNNTSITRDITLVAGSESRLEIPEPASKATLTVISNRNPATVEINGQKMGKTPLKDPIRLTPGTYHISVAKDGMQAARKTVSLSPSENKAVRFTLDEPASSSMSPYRRWRILQWAGIGGALVSGALCGTFWGLSANRHAQYTSEVNRLNGNMKTWDFDDPKDDAEEQQSRRNAMTLKRDAEKLNAAAIAMSAATAAFAIFAGVSAYMKLREEEAPESLAAFRVSTTFSGMKVRF